MKVAWLFLLSLALVHGQNTADQEKDATGRSLDIVSGLYITLRNIAFPDHPLSNDKGVENRFLLLMPGKVLNYFDYFPGSEYTKFIQNPNAANKETVVPPHVMEKWFDLADSIPSSNPMNGQDTGKSLANVYSSILHEIKTNLNFEKSSNSPTPYDLAVSALNRKVDDPEPTNSSSKVPLLSLYERYRDLYNDRKLEMEDIIEEMRKSLGSIDYELWFQRHYPSLQSKVESAYTRWLIFGQKEDVEAYITNIDSGSSGQVLEQARMSLRAAGVSSLDRTRTVYPVSFEPSDWYKYLLPKVQKPSRDQLQLMLGKLYSKINAITAMIKVVNGNNTQLKSAVNSLKSSFNSSQIDSKQIINEVMNYQFSCLRDPSGTSNDCSNYDKDRELVIETLLNESQAFSAYQYANYFDQSKADFIRHLQAEKDSLDAQASTISALLGEASPYLGGILDAPSLEVAGLADSHADDEWMQFEYDSNSFEENKHTEQTSLSVTAQMSFHILFFGGHGEYSYSKDTAHLNDQLAKSTMRVKGELLRVTIKRPWFKPEVFENPELTYEETDGLSKHVYVSPGRGETEVDFYNLLRTSNQYKLPEYTTAFLLARNIELEFSGVDEKTVASTMSRMSHFSGGGGFLFFHASASVTSTKQTSDVQVKRTANGMKINIPGAQIIGYYTETLPRFPVNQ